MLVTLAAAVEQLSEKLRKVVVMYHLQGMKLVEIGLKPVEAFYLYWFSSLTYLVMKIKIISGQSANGDLSF